MTENSPLVSIITGYYNRENYVDNSIKSLVNQSYSNIEILIFDDCSTDKTYDKLKALAQSHHQIVLIKNNFNKGFVKSMNDAIKSAKGKYIAIHGSGDISLPQRIEKQVEILQKYDDVGIVGCEVNNITIDSNNTVLRSELLHNTNEDFYGCINKSINHKNPFTHGEVMFRKLLFDKVGGYREEFKYAQDRDLWARMSSFYKIYILKEKLYSRYLLYNGVGANFQKSVIQAFYSELGIQCHEQRLNNENDYISKYGSDAFYLLKFTKRLTRKLIGKCNKEFRLKRYDNGRYLAKLMYRREATVYSTIAYILYYKLPYIMKIYANLKEKYKSTNVI